MSNAITYKDMFLSLPGFYQIRKLTIQELPGKHSKMSLEAAISAETDEQFFHALPETISLNYILEAQEYILFKGVLSNAYLKTEDGVRILEVEALDATYWMDIDRKNRCFQNLGLTVQGVISEIMKGYGNSISNCNIPDIPIGELIFQYEETDWEFLNRFISRYHDTLYPSAVFDTIHFQAGVAVQDKEVDWDTLPKQKLKNFEKLSYLKQNGFSELLSTQFTRYCLSSYDVATLGSRVLLNGNFWYVSKVKRQLRSGLLVHTYELCQKEAMMVEQYYNPRLTGTSQNATVMGTMRDRVQVTLQQDFMGESCYWFPFSSVSSSSDGSGWYCMPEGGESVRVYFPTEKEKDAYVITCIKGHAPTGGSDPMGNPKVRSISSGGNQVQFLEDGILIAATSGSASVDLKKDGTVTVSAPAGIDLSPSTICSFSANTIDFSASASIKIVDDAGAGIIAGPAAVFFNAQEIYEN